jgi:hypothetical protein
MDWIAEKKHLLLGGLLISGLLMFTFSGCGDNRREKEVNSLLAGLQHPQASVRDSLFDRLEDRVLLKQDLPALYAALQQPYPYDSVAAEQTQLRLLQQLREVNDQETPDFLAGMFEQTSKDSPLRLSILQLLTEINSPTSIAALRQLLLAYPEVGARHANQLFEPLLADPAQLRQLFPAALPLIRDERLAFPLLEALAVGLEEQLVDRDSITDQLPLIEEVYTAQQADRDRAQPNSRAYLNAQASMQAALRCLSHWPAQQRVATLMAEALEDEAFDSRFIALRHHMEQAPELADSLLRHSAEDLRYRNRLFEALRAEGLEEVFPANLRRQEALAEGDLARWLSQPAHGGAYPDDIEQLGTYQAWEGGEPIPGRFFLFRYQKGREWEEAISGPYPADSSDLQSLGALTGSLFKLVEEDSVKRIVLEE